MPPAPRNHRAPTAGDPHAVPPWAGLATATRFARTNPNAAFECSSQPPPARCCDHRLNPPYAPTFVLNCLTANVAAVIDKKLVMSKEQNGDLGYAWLKTSYAGSGPLKIREWRANEILALERNDNYHGA